MSGYICWLSPITTIVPREKVILSDGKGGGGLKKLHTRLDTVASIMKTSSRSESESLTSPRSAMPVLAIRESLENIGYDLELYKKIVVLYLERYAMPDDLIESLWGDDLYAIEECATELLEVTAIVGARKLSGLSREIQDLAWSRIKPNSVKYGKLLMEEGLNLKNALEKIDWKELKELCPDTHY